MSMMPGCHKRGNDAETFPCPSYEELIAKYRKGNTGLNYCDFLFGEVNKRECVTCKFDGCIGQEEA